MVVNMIIHSDIILCVSYICHPERSEGFVPVYPDEMLHCVQHYAREICELNYDAVYSVSILHISSLCII